MTAQSVWLCTVTEVPPGEVVSVLSSPVSWIKALCHYSITEVQHPLTVFFAEADCVKIVTLVLELLWFQ